MVSSFRIPSHANGVPTARDPASTASQSARAIECDALVVGSGAMGLAAALTARLAGLNVIVVEKAPEIGGCSAYSFGMLWMPCNPVSARHGITDDRSAALAYLQHEMGAHFEEDAIHTYLEYGPIMLAFFERHCGLHFVPRENFPDYRPEQPGAHAGGRSIIPVPYDGRELGDLLKRLKPPQKTFFGMTFTPTENKLISSRSPAGLAYLAKRTARHAMDLLWHGRSTYLTGGNALVARLLKAAHERGIRICTSTAMRTLLQEDGRVTGALVESGGHRYRIHARRGVVLACGGFAHDVARCASWFKRPMTDGRSWALAPGTCDGDGLRAALELGAQAERDLITEAFWAPVSRIPAHTFSLSGHFHDRFKPGFVAITPNGKRFANEADSNHHFAEALLAATPPGEQPTAWLICDHLSLFRVGMGEAIHGAPFPIEKHLRSGYLIRRESLAELAGAMNVPRDTFLDTIEKNNAAARSGVDTEFGKGDSSFNRYFCGKDNAKNPCLGKIERAPFYAVRFGVGHMATLAGIKTNLSGNALHEDGHAISGLYLAGNDRVNLFKGACPGGGITLGPGLTWAYLTGLALAGQPVPEPRGLHAVEVVN